MIPSQVTQSPCECKSHVVFHDDHVNKPTIMSQWIEQCKLHASAAPMLELLKEMLNDMRITEDGTVTAFDVLFRDKIKALLATLREK